MRRKWFLSLLLMAVLVLTLLPAAEPTQAASNPAEFIFDVSEGDITIQDAGDSVVQVVYGPSQITTDPFPETQEITITTSTPTSNGVTVESDGTPENPIKITLDGVNISSGGCAFDIRAGSIVNLTLAAQSVNSLTSGDYCAGLQVPDGAKLTIGGEGELTATGGTLAAGIGGSRGGLGGSCGDIIISGGTVTARGGNDGAGIGGGSDSNGGSIKISGGKVTAIGGIDGAGIGGGIWGSGGEININGGEVTATGGVAGAGIGGGNTRNGGDITISGGTVTANGGNWCAGIGNGAGGSGGEIKISGGTVTARGSDGGAGIGGAAFLDGGTVYVSGGSVKAVAGGGSAQAIGHGDRGGGGTLTNGAENGNQAVNLTVIAIPDVSLVTKVVGLTIPSAAYYGTKDLCTDAEGKLYLWLPGSIEGARVKTADKVYNWNSSLSTFEVDTAPPSVTDVTPSGTNAPTSSYLAVTFSEEMRTEGAVSFDGGATQLTGGSWNDEKTVYMLPYSGLAYNTEYTVTISGFRDYSGNEMAPDVNHSFTTVASSDATLSGLTISQGTLSPAFAQDIDTYTASVANSVDSVTLTASVNEPHASMTLKKDGGAEVPWDGTASSQSLAVGANLFTVTVTAQDGTTTKTYTITVTRAASRSSGGSGSSTPVYRADVSGGRNLPVTINSTAHNASVDISAQLGSSITGGGHEIITMPSIPGVSSYTLGIPVSYLSTPGGGTLTFRTDIGSITLPAGMMAGIPGAEGKKAAITIGVGDKSGLPEEIRNAIGNRPLIELSLTLDGEPAEWNNPNAPVTISIPYEPTAEELANPEGIVIWYIDGNGNAVCVPNGHYDPVTGTVTFSVTHFSRYAVAYKRVSFSDVPTGAWYAGAVRFIAARDITSGTGAGRFSPGAKLTRSEFIVMLMKAYGIAPDTKLADNFSDAGKTWYTGYLAAAKRLGITSGTGGNMFMPGKEITRQEMFTLLCNTLKIIGQMPAGSSGRTLSDFSDAGQIAPWAKDSMAFVVQTGIAGGSGGRLNPTGVTTRAEMAQVLYNLLKL